MAFVLVPVELWKLVMSYLSVHDLTSLSLSCAHLLPIVRPALYRFVRLTARSAIIETLSLLERDKQLANCVMEITLERTRKFDPPMNVEDTSGPSLVNAGALGNLTSLKRVTLRGPVFQSESELNVFARVLSAKSGTALEELTYTAHVNNESWPGDQMQGLKRLKKLTWKASHGGSESSHL